MEFKEGEAAAIGRAMYAKIRDDMEENHWGQMVVIDVKSGDYEIGGGVLEPLPRRSKTRD